MPYIPQERRDALEPQLAVPTTAGELNYRITRLFLQHPPRSVLAAMLRVEAERYIAQFGLSYGKINDIVGAMICAMLEYTRRTGSTPEELN